MFTIAAILLNAIFVAMDGRAGQSDTSVAQLLAWGGNLGALTLHGEPGRLVSAMYLHVNIAHIASNMVVLLVRGQFVERDIGAVRTFAVYTICGVAGGLLSALGHPDVVAVGASGAIAGLLGVMVVFYLAGRAEGVSGGGLFRVIAVNAVGSLAPGVDALAHLGGFVAGLASGGALIAFGPRPRLPPPSSAGL
jgi:rhomboid protease GluP